MKYPLFVGRMSTLFSFYTYVIMTDCKQQLQNRSLRHCGKKKANF